MGREGDWARRTFGWRDCPKTSLKKIREEFGKAKIVHHPDSVAMEICWTKDRQKRCVAKQGKAILEPLYYAVALAGAKKATVELVADMCLPKREMKRLGI